jgi:hypothetical protein
MLIRETLKFAAALAAVAAVTAWTAPANAVLMVTMQDELGATFHCVDNGGACDFSGAADSLLTLVNFGAINNDTAAHTLNMYVSDTDFLGPVSGIASSAGILFSNAVGSGPSSLEFYADTGNTQGANLINFPGVLLASAVQTPTTNPQQFLGNDFAAFSDPNLFSMTQVAHINLRGGGSFTDFGMNMQNVNAVPVPAALPLLGSVVAGFGAFGAWRRRKLSGGSTAH